MTETIQYNSIQTLHTCVLTYFTHAILVCAHGPVNTCNTQEMHVMSLHLVCRTTRVV